MESKNLKLVEVAILGGHIGTEVFFGVYDAMGYLNGRDQKILPVHNRNSNKFFKEDYDAYVAIIYPKIMSRDKLLYLVSIMHRANRIGNPCLVLEDRASDKNHDPQPDSEYMNELRDLFKDKINIESVKTKGEASTAFCRFYNNHLKEIKGGNK